MGGDFRDSETGIEAQLFNTFVKSTEHRSSGAFRICCLLLRNDRPHVRVRQEDFRFKVSVLGLGRSHGSGFT